MDSFDSNNRLQRIENKLETIEAKTDKLNDAFIILAHVEEKQAIAEQMRIENNRRYDDDIAEILSELRDMRKEQITQDQRISNNERVVAIFIWGAALIISAMVGAYALQLFP